jgi:hypothetical protein
VRLDRRLAQVEPRGDLGVGEAGRDQREDVGLPTVVVSVRMIARRRAEKSAA